MVQQRIAICNHKGGVGKTSLATHLAGAIAERGQRVLLVDGDSQGDLSGLFLPSPETLPYSVADLFAGTASVRDVLQPTAFAGISILPADRRLNRVDLTDGYAGVPAAAALADAVAELAPDFDYVIYDCPPRPHLAGFAALVAADELIVPVQPSQFAVRSLGTIHAEVELARQTLNPRLRFRGYLLSMVPSRAATQEKLRAVFAGKVGAGLILRAAVPLLAGLDTAINVRQPITVKSPKSRAADVIRAVVAELLGGNRGKVARAA